MNIGSVSDALPTHTDTYFDNQMVLFNKVYNSIGGTIFTNLPK